MVLAQGGSHLIPETKGYSLEEIEPALLRLQERATA
jgi:hypothetical protein